MALGVLEIIFIVIVIVAITLQILLYVKDKPNGSNLIYIINTIFVILLSYIAYTASPANYTGQKSIAIVWSVIAVIGLIVKLRTKQSHMVSKLILTAATAGALVQVLFF